MAEHRALVMRIDLNAQTLGEPAWPPGVLVRTFATRDAAGLHALLAHAYRHGGGSAPEFATWLAQMTGDEEYDPELWLLASADGTLAGAILGWTSGFVKDLVVHDAWRRRGLGEALLRQAFAAFAARGMRTVALKVWAENSAAVRLYERVGMRVVDDEPG